MTTWMRVADAARFLGVTRQAVYLAIWTGRIQYHRQHRLLVVDPTTFNGGQHERTQA